MKLVKIAFKTFCACLVLASVNACSGEGGGSTPTPAAPATPNPTQAPAGEPVLVGKVEVSMWDAQGYRLYSDKYENTKTEQVFKCFYDKRATFNALRITGYNPASKVTDIKRFFVTMGGNFTLKEGPNELRTTAGNSVITIDDKAPAADKPIYDPIPNFKVAMSGCDASLIKEGDSVKGELVCGNITDSAFKDGPNIKVGFNCALTTLK